mmetsp:Transcript_10615/g.43447  ORF Transcript_10615/g.43447 Transcript_10615/m.43447 type:complete len:336 (-) Transcript_10615:900-1907(-)
MSRLDGRLQLVAPRPAVSRGSAQQGLGLVDGRTVPPRRVLLGQRHIGARSVAPRLTPGLRVQHQRQQPQRLGLLRQQRGHEPGQPDRFVGEFAATWVGAGRVGPGIGVGGVDGRQHGAQAFAKRLRIGQLQSDAGLADLGLGTDQALAHRGGCDQKGIGDGRSVETQHGLQHQRCAGGRVDGRVGAGEHQRQAAVRQREGVGLVLQRRQPFQPGRGFVAAAPPAQCIDGLATRDGQQPGLGVGGHAVQRPTGQRGFKGVGQRVFGAGHIAGACRQVGHQPPIAAPRRLLGGHGRRGAAGVHIGQTGRTSTLPWLAPGQRAAQLSAASRSGTSIRK